MGFSLEPGKLGFKLGEVLVGLQSGTTDTPETIDSTQHALHVLSYLWNADTLAYEPATTGGLSSGADVYVTNQLTDEKIIIDTASDVTVYIGYSVPGTASSSAGWKIKKISIATAIEITWADGNLSYDNVWDNRASLSYS